MGWFRERISTFNDAMGPRRYVLVPIVGTVIGVLDWLSVKFLEASVSAFTGMPSWALALFVATLLVAYFLREFAVQKTRPLKDADPAE